MVRLGRGSAGVTLLETLVAITLFALMMVVLARSETFVLSAWQRGKDRLSGQESLVYCRGVMQRQVRSAAPMAPPKGYSGVASFQGEEKFLRFITALPLGDGGPGLWSVTYSLTLGPDGAGWLVAQQLPALDASLWSGRPRAVEGVALLKGVRSLRFTYLGYEKTSGKLQAQPSWLSPKGSRLPAAVRVEMATDQGRVSWDLDLPAGRGKR